MWTFALIAGTGCGSDGGTGPAGGGGEGRLAIVPGALLLPTAGSEATLRAVLIEEDGDTVEVTGGVTWQSSQPAVLTVSGAGVATAQALGAAVVTAEAGGLTSTPMLALVAEPVDGALLVSDEQVIGGLVPVSLAAPYEPGWQYTVRLRGVSPAVGQVVLASGGAAVGGKVVSVIPVAGGDVDVVLELLPLSGMFPNLSVNVQMSLDDAALASPRVRSAALEPVAAARRIEQEFSIGNFACKAEIPPGFVFPVTLDAFDVSVLPQLQLDLVVEGSTLRRLVAHGAVAARISANPLITAALEAKAECLLTVRVIVLPIGGPIALLVGGQIPVGVGFEVGAKATFGQLGYDAFYEASLDAEFGIDCTAVCEVVAEMTASPPAGFFKPKIPSFANDLRFDLTGSAFGFAKLTIGNPFIRELRFETVELKAGVEQKFELAGLSAQASDAAYASSFALKPVIEFKTSAKLDAVANLLGITLAELAFAPDLPVISQSPRGTFTITPDFVAPGDGTALGEPAVFTIALDPVNYFGAYAVEEVEIRWLRSDGTTVTLEPGRPGCTELAATQGQVSFSCRTDFLEEHVGEQTFFAFVHTRIFGVPLPVPLEVAVDGRATVTVSGFAINTLSLPPAKLGIGYGEALAADGGPEPFAWALSQGSLPAGLSLDAATGAISGTPTATGSSPFTVQVTASDGQVATRPLSIAVHGVAGTWSGTFNGTFTSFDGSIVRESPGTIVLTLTQDGTAVSGTAEIVAFFGPATGTAAGTFTGDGLSGFVMSATSQTDPPCPGDFAGTAVIDVVAGTMTVNYQGADCNGTITGAVAVLTRN